MENILTDEKLSPKETEQIKHDLQIVFDEVKRNQEKMDNAQKDIERLKIKTRAILDQLEKSV